MLCVHPRAVLRQDELGAACLEVGGRVLARDASGWALWGRAFRGSGTHPPCRLGLAPGWVGYLGFELGRLLERLPANRHEVLGLPLLRMALYDRAIVLDHAEQRAFAVHAGGDLCGLWELGGAHDGEWLERWQAAVRTRSKSNPVRTRIRPDQPAQAYERAVARALEYIRAGDIYQVNLAQMLWIDGITEPAAAYAAIRRSNPAEYAALLHWDGGALASFSPELFLRVRKGQVRTSPIKGTRPRCGDPAADELARRELIESAKDAAELTMIVDLHRNDLGRVCRPGTVRVREPRRLEAHPSVFHTVADVVGELVPGRDALDLLQACFPAGSVSGVPKIRALQIIDELEPVARGAYTGAVGVVGFDGNMTFNVAIRTVQIASAAATLYVGAGIVADSDPRCEYEETWAKARGILAGITAEAPHSFSSEFRVSSCQTRKHET